ncbi:hypothetical protein [Arthrobacter mangrovi]|uniref:Acetoacetate decarboxylase n=1 Tax=Arthrobacter mangrovi TaxID=2966350 RepID=A0ABQ5MZI9_9MICC|nr:hypothetical protein [Arthrobacter mangrovi]GLB69402.1 hypothetical protein AHIS1636_38460 [Arthrobacter mangrovi]
MKSPRTLAAAVEHDGAVPAGRQERFRGYGVMGLPFASGYLLAMRRFPVTSLGPGYTSVWVRTPAGAWTMYSTVPPGMSCPRYFGSALTAASMEDIELQWTGEQSLKLAVGGTVGLSWTLHLSATPATRILSAVAGLMPAPLLRTTAVLKGMGPVAGLVLDSGGIALTGSSPNSQRFKAIPRRVWFIDAGSATLRGVDLGPLGPLQEQARLGGFRLPQRGLFMFGSVYFAPAGPPGRGSR